MTTHVNCGVNPQSTCVDDAIRSNDLTSYR
jgi:hypothetical protein